MQSHDASWRDTAEFVSALEFCGERVTIRAGRATLDLLSFVAGMHGRILPRPVVGHRAFNATEPLVVIGDDEEERWGGRSSDMGIILYAMKINPLFEPERSSLCNWIGCRAPLVNWTTRAPQILWPEASSNDHYQGRTRALLPADRRWILDGD
jgi:hypothetical protein